MNTSSSTLAVREDVAAGIDVGGTKIDALFRNTNGATIWDCRYDTGEFGSVDDALERILHDAGVAPARCALALAGPLRADGSVKLTNQPEWEAFWPNRAARRWGGRYKNVNDLAGAIAGLPFVDPARQFLLKPGVADPDGQRLMVTVSTGLNHALLSNGSIVSAESGHTTWQGANILEDQFKYFVKDQLKIGMVSAERAVSGGQGFHYLYEFFQTLGCMPSLELMRKVAKLRRLKKGIGPAITGGALAGDVLCVMIMEMYGSILGQYFRNIGVGNDATGGIFVIGSVMGVEVARYVVERTSFLKHFIEKGEVHEDRARQMPIYVVTDPVAAEGALQTALAM